MKYTIKPIKLFLKDLRTLSKKYTHIEDDLEILLTKLQKGILEGDRIRGLKEVVYKTRVKSSDNNKGKSGGFRVIYEIEEDKIIIHLIQVYSKSKKDNTNNTEIKRRLANK